MLPLAMVLPHAAERSAIASFGNATPIPRQRDLRSFA